jgi:ribosome-binding factor A
MRKRSGTHRYPRTARLNEVVREALAGELERSDDPRLELVTITGVEVTADMRHATVYYTGLGSKDNGWDPTPERAQEIDDALTHASSRFRATLGREVRMKYLPKLTFALDPSIAQGQRIESILRSIHEKEGPTGNDGSGAVIETAARAMDDPALED